jgi:ribosomal protein S18
VILVLTACTADHAEYIKNVEKLNASEYSKIQAGNLQNFTIIKTRIFDRTMQHEVSNSDDPKDQRQIMNLGDVVYVSSITPPITTKLVQASIPSNMHSSWDKFYIIDWKESTGLKNYIADTTKIDASEVRNYVAFGQSTIKDGVTRKDDRDYSATIRDESDVVYYSDDEVKLKFLKQSVPKGTHPDFDLYYVSDNNMASLFKSSKKGLYRIGGADVNGGSKYADFQSLFGLYQSTKEGVYRAVAYSLKARKWAAIDSIPTKKLICFDLARAYDKTTNNKNRAVTQAALDGILMALGGFSATTFSGVAQSNYNGYYAGHNWSGTGTHEFSGYAKTYDYSYLAQGAVHVLDTVFKENATVNDILIAIQEQQCSFEL